MTFLKSITLLLVAAIANPMCCCLAFGEMDSSAAASSSSNAHACCELDDSSSPEQATPSQDSRDCYHEDMNLSQINDASPNVLSSLADPLSQTCDYLTIFASQEVSLSSSFQASDYRLLRTPSSPGSRLSRAFCVFLL